MRSAGPIRDDILPHALFIAFHYPPEASSSGVLRTLKYTRYLPEFGWRVSVLTVDASAYEIRDAQLESQVPAGTRVVRTRYRNTKRDLSWRGIYPALLAVPDVWIGWLPYALPAGRKAMLEDPVDLLYSTSPHATAHLIASRLAKHARVPWVADFRDPWYEDIPEPGEPRGPLYRGLNRWLERHVVERAAAIVASTSQLSELLQKRYPHRSDRVRAILNGYDEADFATRVTGSVRSDAQLRIVHAGSINADFRDPCPFFAAIGRCVAAGTLASRDVDIRFLGAGPFAASPQVRQALEASGLAASVTFVPRVPYETSLAELAAADLLLLLQASADTAGLVPAKLYEYLRSGKPTLALVRRGAVDDVLAQTGGGWSVDPADSAALDRAVANVVSEWKAGRLARHVADVNALSRFDRRKLAGELAEVFDRLHAARSGVARVAPGAGS